MDVDRCAFDVLQLNTPLVESIRETIRAEGPQSFAWFMQQALYHPEHGYYSSGRCAIGRKGDYFTNVSVGPLFGQLLAAQFAEIWEDLGKINDFVIVEQGAHDGQFARDVLQFCPITRAGILRSFGLSNNRAVSDFARAPIADAGTLWK